MGKLYYFPVSIMGELIKGTNIYLLKIRCFNYYSNLMVFDAACSPLFVLHFTRQRIELYFVYSSLFLKDTDCTVFFFIAAMREGRITSPASSNDLSLINAVNICCKLAAWLEVKSFIYIYIHIL